MSVSARLHGKSVILSEVDLKRLAREYRTTTSAPKWCPPRNLDEALTAMAKMLGYPNLHAIHAQARHTAAAVAASKQPYPFLNPDLALSFGESWPKDLPQRFDHVWRHSAVALMQNALAEHRHGRVDLIALVGATGAGKSILSRAMAKEQKGVVADVGSSSFLRALFKIKEMQPPVVFFDQPASPPKKPYLGYQDPWFSTNALVEIVDLVKNRPALVLVVCFSTELQVGGIMRSISVRGKPLFQSALIVNLDCMRTHRREADDPL